MPTPMNTTTPITTMDLFVKPNSSSVFNNFRSSKNYCRTGLLSIATGKNQRAVGDDFFID